MHGMLLKVPAPLGRMPFLTRAPGAGLPIVRDLVREQGQGAPMRPSASRMRR